MIRSILAPLDGSDFGEQAISLALAIAKRAGAKLELLHILPPLASIYTDVPLFAEESTLEANFRAREFARAGLYLEGAEARVDPKHAANISRVVLQGEIVPLIQRRIDDGAVDLVVMATHGRGTLGRVWLGSVADKLVRTTSIPVLLVPPARTETDLGGEPPLKNILVPLDGSPLAEHILEPAVALGSVTDAAFTLFRVVRPTLNASPHVEGATLDEMTEKMIDAVQTIQERQRREALDYLERIAAPLRNRGLRVTTQVAIDDQPGHAILGAAVAPVDLIAMGTHGRRGLARFFLGSIADKVLRGGSLPMLIHRPKT